MAKLLFNFCVLLVLVFCSNPSGGSEENEQKTGTIRDVEGNRYQIVKIGKQWWMAENLRVNKYRNGEWIINVTGSSSWSNLSIGAYCYYENNFNHAATYGNLYNWYAIQDSRNIAPEGWHVPTVDDWRTLEDYLGGNTSAGGKLKSTGTLHDSSGLWFGLNEEATNESGFSAIPAGYRNNQGIFSGRDSSAYYWSSSVSDDATALYRSLFSNDPGFYGLDNGWKTAAYSIRCVKD